MAANRNKDTSHDDSVTYMMSRVVLPEAQRHFVGVLWPGAGALPPLPITIDADEIVIGRQDGLGLSINDDWVSRRHARIVHAGDEFVLEDLGSSNGTYVDGVPILACVLRPGDWIQIGGNLFRFELRLASTTGSEGPNTWLE